MTSALDSRRRFLQSLFAAAATTSAATALGTMLGSQTPRRAPAPIRVSRLDPQIAVFLGDGGNMALITAAAAGRDDGPLLIDTGYLERAPELSQLVAAHAGAPLRTVFNTHWHVDHVGANPMLGAAGATIVAHANVKTRLSQTITVEPMADRVFAPLPASGLPVRTFTRGGSFRTGAGTVTYAHFPTAHTDGDSYLFFPERNLLHTGDLFWNALYPLIDYSTLGWIGGMAAATAHLLTLCDARTRIIPGHGALATKADLAAAHTMLATLHESLAAMIHQGKNADEAVAAAPSRAFDAAFPRGMKPDAFVRMAYTGILRHREAAA
ncbi:MAG: MBL fold metallo-hydrolase [Terriglobales bacterium]